MEISRGHNFRKKLMSIVVAGVVASSIFTMGFNTAMGKEINLIVDGQATEIMTYTTTVEAFLKSEKIELNDGDVVSPELDTELTSDMDIIISSPKDYYVSEGGNLRKISSVGKTVSEVLEGAGIELDEHDVVTPSLEAKVSSSQTIIIERVERETFTQLIEIPYETITNENDDMYEGQTKVVQAGVNGVQIDTIQNVYVNNELVSIENIESQIESEPVTEIVEVGTKSPIATASQSAQDALAGYTIKQVITMEATAYDPSAGSKTAMGTQARVGAVAVDPKVIPLGTKLYVESLDGYASYGFCTAEDTGGAIKGNKIDLFYSTNSQALQFGRRNVKVYVLE